MSQYSLFLDGETQHADALLLREPDGAVRPARRAEILRVARALVAVDELRGEELSNPSKVKEFLRLRLAGLEHEVCGLLLLDARLRLIVYLEPFRGTLNQASVYPREVLKLVLQHNAAAIILAHNHPSGQAQPSTSDERITETVKQALALIDVRVLDHLIVAGAQVVSMAERGLM